MADIPENTVSTEQREQKAEADVAERSSSVGVVDGEKIKQGGESIAVCQLRQQAVADEAEHAVIIHGEVADEHA